MKQGRLRPLEQSSGLLFNAAGSKRGAKPDVSGGIDMQPSKSVMQRRHYELIAEIIRDNARYYDDTHVVAGWFADRFERDDPKFKRGKFLQACGTGEPLD